MADTMKPGQTGVTDGQLADGPATSAVRGSGLPGAGRQWVVTAVRVAFGLVWAVDAVLKWLPAFGQSAFIGTLQGARLGQPSAVQSWINFWLDILQTNPSVFAHLLAVAESVIALCLIVGAFTNIICLLGSLLSLAIWSTAEGFGGPYVAGGTDIGASIIYVLVFVVLAAAAAGSHWGLDRWLRPRLGRGGWLASPTTPNR